MSESVEQRSEAWFNARLGCGTASRANDMCASPTTAAYQNYLWQLVAERETGESEEGYVSPDMVRGTEKEPIARAAYEAHTGNFVTETGFHRHDSIEFFGASPDGFVGDDGLLEIKCPRTSTHLRYIKENKVPTQYKRQMICQIVCTGRKWVDFVSYDDRVREEKRLFVIRYEPTQEEIDEVIGKIKSFLEDVKKESE